MLSLQSFAPIVGMTLLAALATLCHNLTMLALRRRSPVRVVRCLEHSSVGCKVGMECLQLHILIPDAQLQAMLDLLRHIAKVGTVCAC